MYFTSYNRTKSTYTPSITCNKNDAFTVNESSAGNGKLTYPIGLITSDEIMMAGGKGGTANDTYYLKTGADYWSLSPYGGITIVADGWVVYSTGGLIDGYVRVACGVRGLVSLKPGTRISSGIGTVADPYIIE